MRPAASAPTNLGMTTAVQMSAPALALPVAERIQWVMDTGALTFVHQPIFDLDLRCPVAYEALARFSAEPRQGPDRWFADAHSVGRGAELETFAVERALATLPLLPADCSLTLNVSPETIVTEPLQALLRALEQPDRIVLEITEHAPVSDYDELAAALDRHRENGLRVAVDDAGAGYASLQHVLRLRPDVIKLDRWFAARVEADRATRALAAALAMFVLEMEMTIVAEGIERGPQASVLHNLGVTLGQGYWLGRPGPLPTN